MRIALVYDAVYPWMKGGGEKALWDIAVALNRHGHDVHLFSLQFWDGPATIEREGVILHGVEPATEFYRPNGRRSWSEPFVFAFGLFRSLRRENEFDFIYCSVFPFFSVFSVWLHRILSRRPTPWALGWLEIWGRPYWSAYTGNRLLGAIGAGIEWLCARCCRDHIVLSDLGAKRLHSLLGVSPDRIQVIPRGFHAEKLRVSTTKQPLRVLYAGRLFEYKNLEVILRAWPKVNETCPEATLRIIGDGPELARLTKLHAQLELGGAVEFVPPRATWEEAMSELAASEIFVQPSTREGQSVVVLEALGTGNAVIAARHPESAVSDFLQHGENGLLVEAWDDPAAWSDALLSLLQDPARRRQLAASGRQRAQAFDWDSQLVPRMEQLFQEIAAAKTPALPEAILRSQRT